MEQVIAQLRALPESQQDRVAQSLLAELEEDRKWINSTAEHESKLKSLINDVLADDSSGKCLPLDPSQL